MKCSVVFLLAVLLPIFLPVSTNPLLDDDVPFGGRIVGGAAVNSINDVPYIVALMRMVSGQYSCFCGGSILAPKYILTAAHCTDPMKDVALYVRAGSLFTDRGGQVSQVTQRIQHPQYNTRTIDYDISILVLETSLTVGQAAKLPTSPVAVKTKMMVAGWGNLWTNGVPPDRLYSVNLDLISRSDCSRRFNITDRMICAWTSGKDSCQGDSGGPLVRASDKVLYGIVSFGADCASQTHPGVYTDVYYLRNFILANAPGAQ